MALVHEARRVQGSILSPDLGKQLRPMLAERGSIEWGGNVDIDRVWRRVCGPGGATGKIATVTTLDQTWDLVGGRSDGTVLVRRKRHVREL